MAREQENLADIFKTLSLILKSETLHRFFSMSIH